MASAPDPARFRPAAARRVLVVDDSVVARCVIIRIVDDIPGCTVVGAVATVDAAFQFLRSQSVDLILLDIDLPRIDGLSALPGLMVAAPGAQVLMVSARCSIGSAESAHARSLGASGTIAKPATAAMTGRFATELRDRIVALGPDGEPEPATGPANAYDVIVIGASTGGIHALAPVLAAIPPSMDVPILITQHLPESFSAYFAGQIAVLARRPADVARDSMRITRGRVIVAPGNAHLRIVATTDGKAVRLDTRPAVSGCLPSVDPMFETAAKMHRDRVLAIVLSGMGRDGSIGAGAVRAAGGVVVAQDQATSVVWGMPGSVVGAGLASLVATPEEIGRFVANGRRPS